MSTDKNNLQPEKGDDGIRKDSDHAGTDPDRYKNITTDKTGSDSNQESEDDDADYNKQPKNHTTTEERMINPDRGEK
ncbi:MAG TPA: hypothetical protein VEA37_03505 [Flavobacterium sp.]|nr:hypothetical protein [Flavobacterium sp.]